MKTLQQLLESHNFSLGKVVDFNLTEDRLVNLDFTANNTELTAEIFGDTDLFSDWVNAQLSSIKAKYGIGGYNEHRTIYARSNHFDAEIEPRRLHLGVDIWGPVGTPVYNFYDAIVHSFANNNNFGDYGATLILTYQIAGYIFNVLYGHLNLSALNDLEVGKFIPKGFLMATFGEKNENGFWPPHLHFQIIINMQDFKGDYPGVCKFSDREKYLINSPDPSLILRYTFEE